MKKFFVSALTILNMLFASAQEEKMDVSFTPADNNAETSTNVESTPVESQVIVPEGPKSYENEPAAQSATQQAPAKPAIQQTPVKPAAQKQAIQQKPAQPAPTSTSSKSDDFDSDFFASNNESSNSGGETKNVLGIRFGTCSSKVTSFDVSSGHIFGFALGVVDQIWFGEKSVFSELGLYFTQKGYTLKEFEPSRTRINYLEIPAVMCYRHGRESLNVTYKAGGYVACAINGKLTTEVSESPAAIDVFKSKNEFDILKEGAIGRLDAGLKFGVDFVVRKVQIGFTYDLGLYKFDKKDIIYGDDSLELGYKQLKNRSFQILAGFNFK